MQVRQWCRATSPGIMRQGTAVRVQRPMQTLGRTEREDCRESMGWELGKDDGTVRAWREPA